ncbi:MAG: PIN domain-containing protein [Nitrospirae bacterium]|nr:PIN domain-containing protein [Nitrospirota bacterium]
MIKAFIDTSVILRLLIKDDEAKGDACSKLIKNAKSDGIALHIPPVTVLEIVWVLEKVYKYKKTAIREIIEALLNTPDLRVDNEPLFRKTILLYEKKNIKFADAVMGSWGLEKGINIVYTYDEKDFKRIDGLDVRSL